MIEIETKDKIVETKEMQIYRNTFIYDDTIIQLDNISKISVAPIDKKALPTWAIICVIVGIISFMVNPGVGLLLLAVGVGYCLYLMYVNSRLGHYLTLELNSGRILYFTGKNDAFLKRIMRLIGDCMNHKNVGYTINMEKAVVENMQIGDDNTMI